MNEQAARENRANACINNVNYPYPVTPVLDTGRKRSATDVEIEVDHCLRYGMIARSSRARDVVKEIRRYCTRPIMPERVSLYNNQISSNYHLCSRDVCLLVLPSMEDTALVHAALTSRLVVRCMIPPHGTAVVFRKVPVPSARAVLPAETLVKSPTGRVVSVKETRQPTQPTKLVKEPSVPTQMGSGGDEPIVRHV